MDKTAIGVLTGDGLPSYDAWVQLADRASIAGYFWLEGNALGKAVDISKRLTPSADKAANDSRFTTAFTRLEALNQKCDNIFTYPRAVATLQCTQRDVAAISSIN